MATADEVYKVRDEREGLEKKLKVHAHLYELLAVGLKREPQSVVFHFEENRDLDRILQKKPKRFEFPDWDTVFEDLKAYREALRKEWKLYNELDDEKVKERVGTPPLL